MDFATYLHDLVNRWRSSRPEIRWGSGLVFIIVVAAAISLATSQSRTSYSYLLQGQSFDSVRIQQICLALESEGLKDYEIEGARLKVPSELAPAYSKVLARSPLFPDGFYSSFDEAIDQSHWWTSNSQRERTWQLAKQKSLALLIEEMPEIQKASVILDSARSARFGQADDVRGTVSIKPHRGSKITRAHMEKIKTLVAGAVSNLEDESVTVIDLAGNNNMLDLPDGQFSKEQQIRQYVDSHYAAKIRELLSYVENVSVTVHSEFAHSAFSPTKPTSAPTGSSAHEPMATANVPITVASNQKPKAELPTKPRIETAPKLSNLKIFVTLPEEELPKLGGSNLDWKERLRTKIAQLLPTTVQNEVALDLYPTGTSPSAPDPTSVITNPLTIDSLGPNSLPIVAGVSTTLILSIGVLIWRVRRKQRRTAERERRRRSDPPEPNEPGSLQKKKLVRIEPRANAEHAPHITRLRLNSFDDIRRLNSSSLRRLVQSVEPKLWLPALRGAGRDTVTRVLESLPDATARLVRDGLQYRGPVRLGDVESAQNEVLELVRRLDHNGDLVIQEEEEVEVV